MYFSKMYLVCTVFLVPLSSKACSSESPFITMKQVRGLFSCVGAVKNVAEDMLAQLNREKDKNPNVCSVGSIFVGFVCAQLLEKFRVISS